MGSDGLSKDCSTLLANPLFVVGDAHLHGGTEPSVASDLERLLSEITSQHPCSAVVFNGDAFDLDRVDGQRGSGLGQAQAAKRVNRVLDAFPGLTLALQTHVSQGGTLYFIAGNHDAEILLPAVQRTLRERLGRDPDCPHVHAVETLALRDIFIEHGHQTDPDAAFFPDTASAVRKERLSAFPLACLMTRLFVSKNPRYDSVGYHHKPPLPVLLGILKDYKLAGLAMIAHYPIVALQIAWQSVLGRARQDVPPLSASVSMSSPWAVIRRLYLDRYFGFCLALAVLLGILLGVLDRGFWWVFGVLCVCLLIPPPRRKVFARRDARHCASEAASRVEQGARVVVFGHTHQAFVARVGEAFYANHGAFSFPVEIDGDGQVCGNGQPVERASGGRRRARPYLSITLDPPTCDLRTFHLSSEQNQRALSAG